MDLEGFRFYISRPSLSLSLFPLLDLVGILGFLLFLFWVLFWRVDVRYLERRYYYYQNMALFLDFIFHTIKLVQPFFAFVSGFGMKGKTFEEKK